MSSINEISKESILRLNNEIFLVTDFQHVNPGKGAAFVRTKLKNIRTGKTMDTTFKANESVEIVEVERRKMQYLYNNGEMSTFMDNATYEQLDINVALLENKKEFLKEGLEVMVIKFEGVPLSIQLPNKVAYKIASAEPGVKGDTASGNVTKEAVLETGAKIRVPLFIKEGEEIIVNTETGQYVERA
ncbi:MAG: elongation factor P [Candidatus Magasanikbacteria bacterium]|nr:elongation factor P [Candidatus Magasanikbacteria bacterium]